MFSTLRLQRSITFPSVHLFLLKPDIISMPKHLFFLKVLIKNSVDIYSLYSMLMDGCYMDDLCYLIVCRRPLNEQDKFNTKV